VRNVEGEECSPVVFSFCYLTEPEGLDGNFPLRKPIPFPGNGYLCFSAIIIQQRVITMTG